ncbi:hypothetical protein I5Q34_10295 [Streptomyces sp. AV19]|uniref:hypothetical protein n=1 Tax=Streptomyces sp. AV19 TaxID=2793068 RepID=UPI0018FEA2F0|nr:hypothetical protein [Streptomyces sp. AV19]MBH1934668.1 hypothetical protein [Streptomyces sp. AV19]MDG4530794.1 hypothetical protein [Streptomyces sp. AV19]
MSSSLPEAPPVVVPHGLDAHRRSGLPWYVDLLIALFLLGLEGVVGAVLLLVVVVEEWGGRPAADTGGQVRTTAAVVAACAFVVVVAAVLGRAWITVTVQAAVVVAACSVAVTGYASEATAPIRAGQAELGAPILPSL